MHKIIEGVVFLAVIFVSFCFVGCDKAEFQAAHPATAEAAEDGIEIAEQLVEMEVERMLNLPADTLHYKVVVFPHDLPTPPAVIVAPN